MRRIPIFLIALRLLLGPLMLAFGGADVRGPWLAVIDDIPISGLTTTKTPGP